MHPPQFIESMSPLGKKPLKAVAHTVHVASFLIIFILSMPLGTLLFSVTPTPALSCILSRSVNHPLVRDTVSKVTLFSLQRISAPYVVSFASPLSFTAAPDPRSPSDFAELEQPLRRVSQFLIWIIPVRQNDLLPIPDGAFNRGGPSSAPFRLPSLGAAPQELHHLVLHRLAKTIVAIRQLGTAEGLNDKRNDVWRGRIQRVLMKHAAPEEMTDRLRPVILTY